MPVRAALLAFALALAGCERCGPSGAAPKVPTPTREWLEGRPPADEGAPVDGGQLVVRATAEPTGLNLLHDAHRDGWALRMLVGTVMESLYEPEPSGQGLRPLLAESMEESSDRLAQRVRLRTGVTFHDGAPFGAKDVEATVAAALEPTHLSSKVRAALGGLEAVRALDERTLEVRWRRPSWFGLRALLTLPIYPAAALQGDFDALPLARAPLGTGPFRFEAWEKGSRLTLRRAEQPWGPRAHLDRVVFRFVKDATVAQQLFERGELDLLVSVAPHVWRELERPLPQNAWAIRGCQRLMGADNSFSYIAWNGRRPPLSDPRVRRALALLYPGAAIAQQVDLGLEPATTCPFWSSGQGCDPSLRPYPHDVGRARALLAEAGLRDTDGDGVLEHEGRAFSLALLLTPSSVRLGKIAALYREELAKAGVPLSIEALEPSALSLRVRRHDFDAAARIWTELDAELDPAPLFHSAQREGSNYAGWANPEADALIDRLGEEQEPAARFRLYRELHRLIHDEQPYLILGARRSLDLAYTRARGLAPSVVWYDLRKAWRAPPEGGR